MRKVWIDQFATIWFLLCLVALATCTGCNGILRPAPITKFSSPESTNSQAAHEQERDAEADRRSLLDADVAFAALCADKGAPEAFYEYLAPDATILLSGQAPITGREAIKVHLATGIQGALSWSPREAQVAKSGELGYTWGTYQFHATSEDGKPQMSYGKYVTVWKKQPNNTWKVILDIGSTSPPPAERR